MPHKKFSISNVNLALYTITTLIFMLLLIFYFGITNLSERLSLIADVGYIIYFAYTASFVFLYKKKPLIYAGASALVGLALVFLSFIISANSLYSAMGAISGSIFGFLMTILSPVFELLIIYSIIIPALVLMLFGFYFYRVRPIKKYYRQMAAVLIIAGIAIFFWYQLYGFGYKGVTADDEMVLAYYGFKAIAMNQNPYSINIAQVLVTNASKYGFTILTNNSVVGRLDYPSLFVLAEVPFFMAFHGNATQIIDNGNGLSYLVFLLISLIVFAYTVSKNSLKHLSSVVPFMLVFVFYLEAIGSTQYFLMIAVMLLMFAFIDSRYLWVLLGIGASLQEALWVPILLVIAYVFTKRGLKPGLQAIIGTVLVFALINSYFIALSPGTFLNAVFKPVNGALIPYYFSPGPSLIQSFYTISLPGMEMLFYLSVIFGGFIILYTGNKLLVPVMGLFAYLMLYHTLIDYYSLMIVTMFAIMLMDNKKSSANYFKGMLKKAFTSEKLGFALLFVIIVAAMAGVIIYSHYEYVNEFGISVTSQKIVSYGSNKYDVLTVQDTALAPQNVSIFGFSFTKYLVQDMEGLSIEANNTVTNMSVCNAQCESSNFINHNIMHFNQSLKYYKVRFLIPANMSVLRCAIYKEGYFYMCPSLNLN